MRYLAASPLVVLDVGGGPGAYSCWLAQQGYEVHLIDPVPRHLSLARSTSQEQPEYPIASVKQGDARRLDWPEESCDAVLLMGPLYHLAAADQRRKALLEARRVLRPDGVVIGVGINQFSGLFDGLVNGWIDDPEFGRILERDLEEGQHRNPTSKDYFTAAYFHRPEELEAEISGAGFTVVGRGSGARSRLAGNRTGKAHGRPGGPGPASCIGCGSWSGSRPSSASASTSWSLGESRIH